MAPQPLRLRTPKGVVTIQVDFDAFTVLDFQQAILAASDILPSQQDLKAGYPPRTLEIVPELPLASLGLQPGDQVIVNAKVGSVPASGSTSTRPAPASSAPSRTTTSAADLPPSAPSAPRAPPAAARAPAQSTGPDYVETEGGVLVHRVVPDDNSCLFSSVALVFEQSISKAPQMRQIVADVIRKDPATYSEAILGHPRDQYISTILKPTSWGGAIELTIFAAHFGTEIASVDVESGRVDVFAAPPGATNTGNRCVLIYSGIHYDAASLAPVADAPPEWHQTVFSAAGAPESDPVLGSAKKLATILRGKRAYTNTSTFDLKCEICKQGLKGEKEARAHAAQTGHTSFGEY